MIKTETLNFIKPLVIFIFIFFISSFLIITNGKYNSTYSGEIEFEIERDYIDLSYPININEATIEEISAIDGVNRRHAKLINNFREQIGVIQDLRILLDIKGIGKKTFLRLKKNSFVSFKDGPEEETYFNSKYETEDNFNFDIPKIDINQADWKKLTVIKGIGEKTGKLIINYRENFGRIDNFDQLINVKGVGPKRVKLIKEKFYIRN
jgi:competence ComEA-like helix-hairpin-helix protein